MNILLFDDLTTKKNLLPFTFTKPTAALRVGIMTIREKWEKLLPADYSYLTDPYLTVKFSAELSSENLYINGAVLPDSRLINAIKRLRSDQILISGDVLLAAYGKFNTVDELLSIRASKSVKKVSFPHELIMINHVWDIFSKNAQAVRDDFALLTHGRKSQPIDDPHTKIYQKENIFVEEGAVIRAAIINATTGPVYIGKHAEVHEGAMIRGATALCEGAVLTMGGRIRGDTTVGPYCKVGGEVANSVLLGYSSKAHDGYLGNSVIGEWCNLGAGTNTSNLKNNYKNVRIWNYLEEQLSDTGRQFCGLMMGDHSKCGINTMFNTGTVVGVNANIFGGGFPPAFIPSFSWGGAAGMETYQFQKVLEVIPRVYERRKKSLLKEDVDILKHIFEQTKKYRKAT